MKVLSLAGRNFKEAYREVGVIPLAVGQPVVFMLLFFFIDTGDPAAPDIFQIDMLVPGIILFSLGFLTLFSALFLARDRQSALLTRLLATPLTAPDFILAYITPYILIALLQITACFIIGLILGMSFSTGILLSFIIFIPLAIGCTALGIALGSILSENVAPGVGAVAITIMTLLGGVWMDLRMVGGWMERIAFWLPFAPALDAARVLIGGGSLAQVGSELIWLLGYMVVFIFLGIITFRWRTRR